MSFSNFDLDARVFAGIPATYSEPTPIQVQAIPAVLSGQDVLGLAQTGTGKTAAFGLPILSRLMKGPRKQIRALIVAPTRELATQICEAIRTFGSQTGLRAVTIFGGVSMRNQIEQLRRGPEIVVACPGRLVDHIQQRTIDLSRVEVLVLDEADHMFDMGFLPNIRTIIRTLPQDRQNLMFSATMPKEVEHLAFDVLQEPQVVNVGRRAPTATVAHYLYPVDASRKTDLLLRVLEDTGTGAVLVFTRTKHRAKKLARTLADCGHSATAIQGNLSQRQREEALNGFRSGKYQLLVATDIAARGIDIDSVTHVINYDIPDTVEAYTHRIGRTGRAERSGDALTFITREDEGTVRAIERVVGGKIERRVVDGFASQKPAQSAPVTQAHPRQRDHRSSEPRQRDRSLRFESRDRNASQQSGSGSPRKRFHRRRRTWGGSDRQASTVRPAH
ncbi:MAG: DEAD/DEAH box helicase [Oligoflexia bacterium]|nr:DEAD/DEAH box helicase [Oligoflexia bacterium]